MSGTCHLSSDFECRMPRYKHTIIAVPLARLVATPCMLQACLIETQFEDAKKQIDAALAKNALDHAVFGTDRPVVASLKEMRPIIAQLRTLKDAGITTFAGRLENSLEAHISAVFDCLFKVICHKLDEIHTDIEPLGLDFAEAFQKASTNDAEFPWEEAYIKTRAKDKLEDGTDGPSAAARLVNAWGPLEPFAGLPAKVAATLAVDLNKQSSHMAFVAGGYDARMKTVMEAVVTTTLIQAAMKRTKDPSFPKRSAIVREARNGLIYVGNTVSMHINEVVAHRIAAHPHGSMEHAAKGK